MSYKPLVKLVGALGIATMAVCGLGTPPAHAYVPCGTEYFFYSGGGHCTLDCATARYTCTGTLTGTVTEAGGCRAC
jgi:hypothetical protein